MPSPRQFSSWHSWVLIVCLLSFTGCGKKKSKTSSSDAGSQAAASVSSKLDLSAHTSDAPPPSGIPAGSGQGTSGSGSAAPGTVKFLPLTSFAHMQHADERRFTEEEIMNHALKSWVEAHGNPVPKTMEEFYKGIAKESILPGIPQPPAGMKYAIKLPKGIVLVPE